MAPAALIFSNRSVKIPCIREGLPRPKLGIRHLVTVPPKEPLFSISTVLQPVLDEATAALMPANPPPTTMTGYADLITVTANAAGPPANDLKNTTEHWNAYWEHPTTGARTDFNFYIDIDANVVKDHSYRYLIKGTHATINYVNELTFDLEVKIDGFGGGDVGKILYFYCQIVDSSGDWNLRNPQWKGACVARLAPIPTTTTEWGIVKGNLRGVTASKAYYFCSDSTMNLGNVFGAGNFQNDFGGADQIYDKDTNTFGKVPIFPAMALTGVAGGPFNIGETVEGQTSHATGTVQAIDGNNLFLIDIAGTFQLNPAETVEGQTSHATGTLQKLGSPYVTLLLVPLPDGSYGYFWGWMHQEPKTGAARGKFSNHRRMVFITTTQDTTLTGAENYNSLATTVSHEFQHLIHGCYDPGEETWVDEGCSQFAQDKNSRADTVDLNWLKRFLHNPIRFTLNDSWVPGSGAAAPHDSDVQYIVVELWTLYLEKRFPLNNPAPNNAIAKMVDDPVGLNSPDKTTDADVPTSGNNSVFSRPDQPAPATVAIPRPFDIAGIARANTYRILFEDWVATNYFNKYNNGLLGGMNPISKVTDPAGGGGTVGAGSFNYSNARTNMLKHVYANPGLRGAINPPADVTATEPLEAPAQTLNITNKIGDFANIAKQQTAAPDPSWGNTPWSALNDGTMDYLRFRCAIPFHIYANHNDMHLPTTLNDALQVEGITGGDLGTITPFITNKYGGAAPAAPGHYVCSLDGLDSNNHPRKDVGGTLHINLTQLTGAKRIFFIEERIESMYAILNEVDVSAGNDAQIEIKDFGEAGTDTQAVTVALPAHNTGYTPQYRSWVSLRPKVESITYSQAPEGTNPAPADITKNQTDANKLATLTQTNDVTIVIKFDQEMKNTGPEHTFREGDTLADLAERYYGDPALTNLITPAVTPPVAGTVCTFKPVVFYTVRTDATIARQPVFPSASLTATEALSMSNDTYTNQKCQVTLHRADAAHVQLLLHICGFGNFANDIMGPEETFEINFPATGAPTFEPGP